MLLFGSDELIICDVAKEKLRHVPHVMVSFVAIVLLSAAVSVTGRPVEMDLSRRLERVLYDALCYNACVMVAVWTYHLIMGSVRV